MRHARGPEVAHGRLQLARHRQPGDDGDLGDAGPRRADRATAQNAPASGAVPVDGRRHGYQAVVGWRTASVSAWVRKYVNCWYSGSATILLNASRLG